MLSSLVFAIFVLSALRPASAEVKDRLSLGSSLVDTSACKLSFPETGREYNLCPLFSSHGHTVGATSWEDQTPPTITRTEIKWNFGGPLARVDNTKESEQCPPGTWICMTVTNRKIVDHDKVPARITRLVPIAGQLTASSKHDKHEGHDDEDEILHSTEVDIEATIEDGRAKNQLYLRLHGGTYVQKPQHALIAMRCDESAEEPTSPSYRWPWNGTHWFEWHTRHACPISVRDTPDPKPDDDTPGKDGNNEQPPQDNGDGGQNLTKPTPATSRVWTKVVWLFAVLAAIGVVFAVLTDRLPGAKRVYPALRTFAAHHPLGPLYRRFTFRLGEAGLLRWARRRAGYEDLSGYDTALFDAELDGAEEWVNGRGSGEGTLVGEGEGLPYSASPRKTTFTGVKSYGTR